MAINLDGQPINSISFGGQPANRATLNGVVVWEATAQGMAPVLTLGSVVAEFTSIELFWSVTGVPSSITIEYGTSTSYGSTQTVSATATSYTITGLQQNTNYFFRITATNTAGANSVMGSAMTGIIVPAPQFENLRFENITEDGFRALWTLHGTPDTYTFRYGTSALVLQGSGGTVVGLGITTTNIDVTGLDNNSIYYVRVEATNAGGTNFITDSVTTLMEEFTFEDGYVAGSLTITDQGIPSAMIQNGATDLELNPTSYDLSDTDIPRGNQISFTAPSGFRNSGERVEGVDTATQPGTEIPAVSGTIGNFIPSIVDIPAEGIPANSGDYDVTVMPEGSVWTSSGTNGIRIDRTTAGDRSGITWDIGPTTVARSGVVTLSSDNGVLHQVNWNQLGPPAAATDGDFSSTLFEADSLVKLWFVLGTLEATQQFNITNITPTGEDWTIDSNLPDTTITPDNGSGDGTITVTVEANALTAGEQYSIRLLNSNGDELDLISVFPLYFNF